MNKINSRILACVLSVLVILGTVITAYGITPIDPSRPSSFTLQYKHGDDVFEGVEISSYRIAEVFEDGTYALCGEFKDYPVSIYGITSQSEWDVVASTLEAYVASDKIEPDLTGTTDENGTVVFSDILPGMYMTTEIRIEKDGEGTLFYTFLTVIPYPSESGEHNYDVTAIPKSESYEPSKTIVEYKVVKQWKDGGYSDKRPDFIEADIIRNGEVNCTVKLSPDNNWTYSWEAEDDGSKWYAVEKNVSDEYKVTITESDGVIVITNVHTSEDMKPPQTGDMFVFWPYIVVMSITGSLVLLLGIRRKKVRG